MLTLQNAPPSLESVQEDEEQYKNYGKSIRKLIVDCLQKDPTKRPTASELLKHSFMKKAKDRRYLVQTLLSCAPTFEERSRRALDGKRSSAAEANRLSQTESADWVWSSEDGSFRPNVHNHNNEQQQLQQTAMPSFPQQPCNQESFSDDENDADILQ